jgi:hypothetical protein
MKETVWVLTEEYNLYDQMGEYFLHAWHSKPTATQLSKVVNVNNEELNYILSGGGHKKWEDQWYNLKEVEC